MKACLLFVCILLHLDEHNCHFMPNWNSSILFKKNKKTKKEAMKE